MYTTTKSGDKFYIIKKFTRNNQRYYLIPNDRTNVFHGITWLTEKQAKQKEFYNICFIQYRGKKYNNVIYLVEG